MPYVSTAWDLHSQYIKFHNFYVVREYKGSQQKIPLEGIELGKYTSHLDGTTLGTTYTAGGKGETLVICLGKNDVPLLKQPKEQ